MLFLIEMGGRYFGGRCESSSRSLDLKPCKAQSGEGWGGVSDPMAMVHQVFGFLNKDKTGRNLPQSPAIRVTTWKLSTFKSPREPG